MKMSAERAKELRKLAEAVWLGGRRVTHLRIAAKDLLDLLDDHLQGANDAHDLAAMHHLYDQAAPPGANNEQGAER